MKGKTFKKNLVVCIHLLTWSTAIAGDHTVALTILAEAGNQSEAGQTAVMAVIIQRSLERNISLEHVCRQPRQFSCWNGKRYSDLEHLLRTPQAKFALWLEANPDRIDLNVTKRANHYHATWMKAKPYWAANRKPLYTIGDHSFYRL